VKGGLRTILLLIGMLLAGGCAHHIPPASGDDPQVRADVVRSGEKWTADYRFDRDAPAWVFVRSALGRESGRPWRPESWTVLTPGVRLERRGHFDALVSQAGAVPRTIRIRFTPSGQDLMADYDPALIFTDGSVALYTRHFDVFPAATAAEVEKLPFNLGGAKAGTRMDLRFRDRGGKILHAGSRKSEVRIGEEATYLLFGPAEPVVTADMALIVDPALPAWIREALESGVPRLMRHHAEGLGEPRGTKPTVMVSWMGPTPALSSMGGSVLPGLIVMRYEGEGVLAPSRDEGHRGLWFIAHEAAHFWLGQAVTYGRSSEAWITEGGAELLAFRAVAALDPSYDWRAEIDLAIRDCAQLSTGRGIASAETRGEHRAYYACGALFALVAESSSRRPFPDFVRRLIEENRDDKVVDRREWLAALDDVSGDATLSASIAGMLDNGAEDPKAAIASLLTRAGVPHLLDKDGMPRLR
jgi:hypothetical protein